MTIDLGPRLPLWGLVALIMTLAGCASVPERQPLPREYTAKAGIPGVPEARFWGDEWPTFSTERFATFTESDFRRDFPSSYDRPHNYLAISGGGANGAYGAGLLVGWSASGTRPEFNMVTGVSAGFERVLEIEGVGYRAEMEGKTLVMHLGYSHSIPVEPPANVAFEVEERGRIVRIRGIDKQVVGQLAANIRELRPPEPYKGKGVRYQGEYIRRKAGKAGKAK